jgi:excisionase family DNA binding protein
MGSDVVMTDSGSAPPWADADRLLTTGEAAEVIGVKRRQVIEMVDNGDIAFIRRAPRAWARIPLSAAVAKRAQLAALWEAERRQLEDQLRRQDAEARAELDRLSPPWGTESETSP